MNMNWRRHILVDISDAGRVEILSELAGDSPVLREKFGDILLPEKAGARVPGIVRREELNHRPDCLAVGFCGSTAAPEGRLRVAAFANPTDVVQVTTPFELMSLPIPNRTPSTKALKEIKILADALGLDLGVWGSVALELYTGLPYTHNDSDVDLLVAAAPRNILSYLMRELKALEKFFAVRIDAEVDLPNGYGVHLKELLGQGRMVLGKNLAGVALFPREQILAELSH